MYLRSAATRAIGPNIRMNNVPSGCLDDSGAASTNLSYHDVLNGATPGTHLRLAETVQSFPSDVRAMPFSPQRPPNSQLIPPVLALRVTATFLQRSSMST